MPPVARVWHTDDSSPVKHYLMEYITLCQRRDALQNELDRLREVTLRVTARISPAKPSGKPVPGNGEDAMLRVLDGEARLEEVIGHIGEALSARLALIESLGDERQKTLLTFRYINGLDWETIGYRMHYERSQLFLIHSSALEAAQQALRTFSAGSSHLPLP